MIPANPVKQLSTLIPADPDTRARPGLPPSEERLRELKDAVRCGAYKVPPEVVAKALTGALGTRAS